MAENPVAHETENLFFLQSGEHFRRAAQKTLRIDDPKRRVHPLMLEILQINILALTPGLRFGRVGGWWLHPWNSDSSLAAVASMTFHN